MKNIYLYTSIIALLLQLSACSAAKLLILSKRILITQEPIVINSEWVEIKPNKPLNIIGDGSGIKIDISSYISKLMNYDETIIFSNIFNGKFEAELISLDGNIVKLNYSIVQGTQNSETGFIHVGSFEPLSKKIKEQKFDTVRLRSQIELNPVSVYWENGGK